MKPYKMGYIAAINGVAFKDSPFPVGSLRWDDWDSGYSSGRKDLIAYENYKTQPHR